MIMDFSRSWLSDEIGASQSSKSGHEPAWRGKICILTDPCVLQTSKAIAPKSTPGALVFRAAISPDAAPRLA
jgi:hypothetical protein